MRRDSGGTPGRTDMIVVPPDRRGALPPSSRASSFVKFCQAESSAALDENFDSLCVINAFAAVKGSRRASAGKGTKTLMKLRTRGGGGQLDQ